MTISISEIHQISSHLLGVLARVIKLGDHENFCETYMFVADETDNLTLKKVTLGRTIPLQ